MPERKLPILPQELADPSDLVESGQLKPLDPLADPVYLRTASDIRTVTSTETTPGIRTVSTPRSGIRTVSGGIRNVNSSGIKTAKDCREH